MTKTRTISLIAVLFVLLAVFTGCRAKTQTGAAKKLTDFQLGIGFGPSHELGLVAVEEGFFEEEGLNVTLSPFRNYAELFSGIESGKLDAGFAGATNAILEQIAGHDITIFGGVMSNGHALVLKTKYIPDDFKTGDITVLKGRNIALPMTSIMDYELKLLLRKNGIEIGEGPDKVNFVYFSSSMEAYSAFAGNQIDGTTVIPPFMSIAKNDGHTVVYACRTIAEFENQPCCRQVTLTSSITSKPEVYIAFERALIKAYKFSQENHAKTVEYVAKYADIDKKDLEYEIYTGYNICNPDPDKKATTILKNGLVEFGYTEGKDYDIDKFYNLDIYREALTQLLAEYPNDPVYKSLGAYFASAN